MSGPMFIQQASKVMDLLRLPGAQLVSQHEKGGLAFYLHPGGHRVRCDVAENLINKCNDIQPRDRALLGDGFAQSYVLRRNREGR
jgi:hypothetical protein